MAGLNIVECPTILPTVGAGVDHAGRRQGELTLTLRNDGDAPLTPSLRVEPEAPAQPAWFSIDGAAEVQLAPGAARQAVIRVDAPADRPGSYRFKAVATAIGTAETANSPTVSFEVPLPVAPKVIRTQKAFPWKVVASVAVVALIVVAVLAWTTLGGSQAPVTPPA